MAQSTHLLEQKLKLRCLLKNKLNVKNKTESTFDTLVIASSINEISEVDVRIWKLLKTNRIVIKRQVFTKYTFWEKANMELSVYQHQGSNWIWLILKYESTKKTVPHNEKHNNICSRRVAWQTNAWTKWVLNWICRTNNKI